MDYINITAFYDCCGAIIFSSFGNTGPGIATTPEQIDKDLEEAFNSNTNFSNRPLIIAILAGYQVKKLHDVMLKHGFKEAAVAGSNHGETRKLVTYIRVGKEYKPPKTKKKPAPRQRARFGGAARRLPVRVQVGVNIFGAPVFEYPDGSIRNEFGEFDRVDRRLD